MTGPAQQDQGQESRRIRRLIAVFGLTGFAGALATRATDPLVAEIAGEFVAPADQVALLGTAFALPYALVQPVLGPVGDAAGKRRVIGIAVFLLAVMLVGCTLAPTLGTLMLFRALAGAAGGGVMPLMLAVMGDEVPMKDRQVAISRLLVFSIFGQISGGALAGTLADLVGWRGVQAVCAAVALVAGAIMVLAERGMPPEPRTRFDPILATQRYRAILTNPAALTLYAAVSVEGMLVFGSFPFIAPLLIERGIGGTAQAGLAIGAFGIGGFIYAAIARAVLSRIGQGRMIILGGVLCGAALLGLGLASVFGVVAASALLLGTGFYMIHNSIQTRVTEVAPKARGSAVALHAFSFFAGQSLGPVVFGAGFQAVGPTPTLVAAALGLVLLGFALGRRPG